MAGVNNQESALNQVQVQPEQVQLKQSQSAPVKIITNFLELTLELAIEGRVDDPTRCMYRIITDFSIHGSVLTPNSEESKKILKTTLKASPVQLQTLNLMRNVRFVGFIDEDHLLFDETSTLRSNYTRQQAVEAANEIGAQLYTPELYLRVANIQKIDEPHNWTWLDSSSVDSHGMVEVGMTHSDSRSSVSKADSKPLITKKYSQTTQNYGCEDRPYSPGHSNARFILIVKKVT